MGFLKGFRDRKEAKEKEKSKEEQRKMFEKWDRDRKQQAVEQRAQEERDNIDIPIIVEKGDFYPCYFLIARSRDYGYINATHTISTSIMNKTAYKDCGCGPDLMFKESKIMDLMNKMLSDAEQNREYFENYAGGQSDVCTDVRHIDGVVYAYCKFDSMLSVRGSAACFGVCFKEKDFEKLDVDGFIDGVKDGIKKVYLDEQNVFEFASQYPVIFDSKTENGIYDFITRTGEQFEPFDRQINFKKAIQTKDGKPFLPEGEEWKNFVEVAKANKQENISKPKSAKAEMGR